ncbi:hypothetical protein PSY81_23370, partial [Shigella flexneri]|nr:hypothetical protein [Shigella flexneri]
LHFMAEISMLQDNMYNFYNIFNFTELYELVFFNNPDNYPFGYTSKSHHMNLSRQCPVHRRKI